jgi:hypothetical protein
MPKSAWRTIETWSSDNFVSIAENLKLEIEMNSVKGRTWVSIISETDFCQRCQVPYSTEKNPKMVSSCGHVSCLNCAEDDAMNRLENCFACKRRSTPKVT